MKNPLRKQKRTAPRSARSLKHHIPIGLQIIVRAMEADDYDPDYMRGQLKAADIRAERLLRDPIATLSPEGPIYEIAALAKEFGADKPADRIEAVIKTATHDPGAWLCDHRVPWQEAGLYLGLCLGFRIAAGFNGKDGQ